MKGVFVEEKRDSVNGFFVLAQAKRMHVCERPVDPTFENQAVLRSEEEAVLLQSFARPGYFVARNDEGRGRQICSLLKGSFMGSRLLRCGLHLADSYDPWQPFSA